jgi:hypothetical protein
VAWPSSPGQGAGGLGVASRAPRPAALMRTTGKNETLKLSKIQNGHGGAPGSKRASGGRRMFPRPRRPNHCTEGPQPDESEPDAPARRPCGYGITAPCNSNGHQRRLPIRLHNRTTEFPPTSGDNVPAGTLALVRSFLALRCSSEQNALRTLIHQRHLTPSCGGHAPTAERTLHPARMLTESLTPRPELENGQDP